MKFAIAGVALALVSLPVQAHDKPLEIVSELPRSTTFCPTLKHFVTLGQEAKAKSDLYQRTREECLSVTSSLKEGGAPFYIMERNKFDDIPVFCISSDSVKNCLWAVDHFARVLARIRGGASE